MAIAPDDRVLEIGCGTGAAVSLVCERLAGGSLLAIDRSPSMIAKAKASNRGHECAGRALLRVEAFDAERFAETGFDKIFAFNVGLFWRDDAPPTLRRLRGMLRRGGHVYAFYETPSPAKTRKLADAMEKTLRAAGFASVSIDLDRLVDLRAVRVTAHDTQNR
jgi:SAM-dependent methyltransferase